MDVVNKLSKYLSTFKSFLFVCIFISFPFIPFFCGFGKEDFERYLPTDILLRSIHSLSYRYALVATICSSAPLLIDLLFDYFSPQRVNRRAVLSRCKLLTIILSIDIILFAVIIPYNACYMIPSLYRAREITVIYIVLNYLVECRPEIITRTFSTRIIFLYSIGMFLRLLKDFLDPKGTEAFVVGLIGMVFLTLPTLLGVYFCYFAFKKFKMLNQTKELTLQDRSAIVYIISTSLVILTYWIIFFIWRGPWQRTEVGYLVTYSYTTLAYSMIVTIFNGRINRQEAINIMKMLDKKKMFVRYVSHEIRTPLNIVYLGLQLLKKELQENQGKCDLSNNNCANTMITVNEISESCDTAITILNDLLDYDKLDEGTMKLELSEYDVNELIFSAATPFSVQAREAGITLTLRKPEAIIGYLSRCKISADKYKINQVVRNLVSNALKFTPQGGSVDLKVSVVRKAVNIPSSVSSGRGLAKQISNRFSKSKSRSRSRDNDHNGWLRIVVTDTGAGISLENQSKLFKEIIQFNPGKLQGGHGSGLGLWISRGIIDLHGGRIKVYSEGEGCGSTFIVDIPMNIDPEIAGDDVRFDSQHSRLSPQLGGEAEDSIGIPRTPSHLSKWSQHLHHQHSGSRSGSETLRKDSNIPSQSSFWMSSSQLTSKILPVFGTPYQIHPKETPPHLIREEGEIKSESREIQVELPGLTGNLLTTTILEPLPENFQSNENSISAAYLSLNRQQLYHTSSGETETLNDIRKRSESSLPMSTLRNSLPGTKLRMLVVDDSVMNRKMTCRVMQGSALYCDQATDGLEAVEIIRKSLEQEPFNGTTGTTTATTSRQYDVILMDYMMPNMDGPTATKAIRGLGFSGQIIGITGNALPCDITTFMNHGANKVLTKPFNINELNAALAMSMS